MATSAKALGRWVGGWEPVLSEGTRFTAINGSRGEICVVRPGERVCLTWTPARTDQSTLIELTITAAESGLIVAVHHGSFADESQREAMLAFWRQALAALAVRAAKQVGV